MTAAITSTGRTARASLVEKRTAAAVAAIFVLAIVAAFLLPEWGVLTPDTKPELYLNPSRMLGRELSAWRPVPALGSPNYHPGIAPITAVVLGMQQLGVPAWLSQRLLAILLTLVAAAGTAALVRRLTTHRWLVPVVAGVAYAVHPYAVVAGATLPIRLPHAVLPWFVLAAVLALGRGGWTWPASTALAYFAMGGINGGIVNLLLALALPVTAVFVARTEDASARTVWRRVGIVAALCVLVSLYWLVPTLLAAGSSGTDIAASTEAPEAVAATSTPIESLRGLGLWTLYLVIGGRPEIAGHVDYLTNGILIAATLALPVLAAVGIAVDQSRARLLAVGLLVTSLPLMIGLYPPDRSSPLGKALAWAFDHVPAAIGFRTTNKIGSMLALGVAIAVGIAVVGRLRRRPLLPLVLAVVGTASLPLWVGDAQPVTLDVPEYWHEASAELDTQDPGRLMFVPGNFLARYDWGYAGVDDLDTALFDQRQVVWRPSVPAGSRPAHNLLTAFDVGMNTGHHSPDATAAYLSLLGVSDVLVRADSANTSDGAATAADLLETYAAVDGARTVATWGPRTVQVPDLGIPAPPVDALTQVALPGNRPTSLAPLRDNLVLAGDAFAIGNLVDAGYAPQRRTLGWLDQLSGDELVRRLADGGRLVLTDTNQRRRWDVRGLDAGHSTVLRAVEPLEAADTRARTLDPATQTTASVLGGSNITSSDDDPSLFRIDATAPPSFAADGDPNTTWLTGPFNTEEESWIRLDYGDTLPLDDIRISIDTSLDRWPSRLRVLAEHENVVVDVPANGQVLLGRFSESSWIRVEVVAAVGTGQGPVGITDVSVAGRSMRTGMQLPSIPADLDVRARVAIDHAPLDVVLTRMQGDPTTGLDDEERGLVRDFALPDERTMTLAATVRPNSAPEHLLDAAALAHTEATIDSPTPTEAGPLGRASQAFDGDAGTAWRPSGPSGRVTVRLPEGSPASELVVRRPVGAPPALLRVDAGGLVHEATLTGSTTVVRLPRAIATGEVSLIVASPGLDGQVAPIVEFELAGLATEPISDSTRLAGCASIGTIDGFPLWVHVDATLARLLEGSPLPVDGCDRVPLASGSHRYDAGIGWTVDQLVLTSHGESAEPTTPGTAHVLDSDRTSRLIEVVLDEPALLSTGIAWDPRWQAAADGQSLGPPTLAAGYAVGWELPAGRHEVTVRYGPQVATDVALVASGVVVAGLGAAVLAEALRRRRRQR